MAYTNTPAVSTYQNKVIPFAEEWETRDYTNSKDVQNINVVWDIVKEPITGDSYVEAIKREGVDVWWSNFGSGLQIMGIYTWKAYGDGYIVVVTPAGVYLVNAMSGALPIIVNSSGCTISGNPGVHVGFDEYQYDNGQKRIVFSDGISTYVYDGGFNTAVKITDADFPTPHLPYPVVLDGYLFISDLKGNIQNSALNDPMNWAAGDFISVESYSDNTLALCRVGQYICALGNESIQYFYDAANPTGTPLAAQTTVLRIGYMGGLAQHGEDTYFIGQPPEGAPSVYQLTGLKAQPIASLPASRRQIRYQAAFIAGVVVFKGRAVYLWREDKDFIGLNQITYGLDLSCGLWSQFNYGTPLDTLNYPFPINDSCTYRDVNGIRTLMLFRQSANIYSTTPTANLDNGQTFDVVLRTKNLDFGSRRNKFGSRLLAHCDQLDDVAGHKYLTVVWYKDDYRTPLPPGPFSPGASMDLSNEYPVVWGLGVFRKLAIQVTYNGNQAFRMRGLEIDFNLGGV
jgi:hypothetical protein